MLNRDGIRKTEYTNPKQILANVELQSSVGCIVSQSVGIAVGTRKIAKAGTPIKVDLLNRSTAAVAADKTANAMNAILLHDVDVTAGNANATALIFGFVNLNMVDEQIVTKITDATGNANATKLITFMKA